MSKLTAQTRAAIPTSDFALPGRRYPIEDENHKKAALSMVSRYGTPDEKAKVRAAIAAKFGSMRQQR